MTPPWRREDQAAKTTVLSSRRERLSLSDDGTRSAMLASAAVDATTNINAISDNNNNQHHGNDHADAEERLNDAPLQTHSSGSPLSLSRTPPARASRRPRQRESYTATERGTPNAEESVEEDGYVHSATQKSILMFPLGGEELEHLRFPSRVLHYSVSPNARFAFVVGELESGSTQLNVWDLHKGTRRLYKYSRMYHIRHFYALNDRFGFAVSSTSNLEQFALYSVCIDHATRQILVNSHITNCLSVGHVSFWSSCRYKDCGILFAIIDQRGVFIYKYEQLAVTKNAGGRSKSFRIERDQLNNYYFVGQPFVHGDHVMFLEREHFSLKFSGRIVRIGLEDGKMDCVDTHPDRSSAMFAEMPNKIKHVERNGQLWTITECTPTNNGPIFGTHLLPQRKRKFVSVLSLADWTWRQVRLDVDADYDEMSLDVTDGGTVVIIKRGNCLETSIVCGFYFLQSRSAKSLMDSSLHKLLSNYGGLRFLDRQELQRIGLPNELI